MMPTVPLDSLVDDVFRRLNGTLNPIEEEMVRHVFQVAGRLPK
jgi:hypothetical protein